MIDACVELKVKRLIYTSSPSVVFDGVHEILNGDESLPYPSKVLIGLVSSHNFYNFLAQCKKGCKIIRSRGSSFCLIESLCLIESEILMFSSSPLLFC